MNNELDLFCNKPVAPKHKVFFGDNAQVLKDLEPDSIDFIYIDPPYNTSNKFSYNDTNDKWTEDISLRLDLGRNVLKNTGVICISIDDTELANLLQICYGIFGKKNYVGTFITRQAQRSNARHINITHEYIVVFAKNKKDLPEFFIERVNIPEENEMIQNIIHKVAVSFKQSKQEAVNVLKKLINKYAAEQNITWIKNYSNVDDKGRVFFAKDLSTPSKPGPLTIEEINLTLPALKTRGWSSKEKFIKLYKQNRLCFKQGRPYEIQYLEESVDNVPSILNFYSRQGTNDLKKLGLYGVFDTPKPVELIKFLIRATVHKDAKILDFYAGSGTTGQAVYEINNEDKRNHSFILIQQKEPVEKTTSVYSALTQLGIQNPTVADILLLRLNTFLKLNKSDVDFEIKEF